MNQKITYLITGCNRGIGLALTASLLLRPATIVVGTIRNAQTNTDDLQPLPTHEESELIILPLDSSLPSTFPTLVENLTKHGIKNINTLILNSGLGSSFDSALETPLSALEEHFQVNTLAPIHLFQTLYHLFPDRQRGGKEGKMVLISSSLGSIAAMEGGVPSLAYGVSKAGVNYFVRKVHFECEGIVALALHPGWVKTANGQNFADAIGVKEPPMSVEDSAMGVLEQIDNATKETSSGCFLSYDGTTLPW